MPPVDPAIVLLIVVAILVLIPLICAAVDLVRQAESVERTWLALALPFVLGLLAAAGTTQAPWGTMRLGYLSVALSLAWLVLALELGLGALGLAVSRGLRPGGPTERSRAAWGRFVLANVVAVGCAVTAARGDVLAVPLGALASACCVWIVALDREGPPRLTHGRRVAGTWLGVAGAAGGMSVLHVAHANVIVYHDGAWWMGAPAIGSALIAGVGWIAFVRFLVGPLHRSVALLLVAPVSIGFVELVARLPPPLPMGARMPVWEDLAGRPGPRGGQALSVDAFVCVQGSLVPPCAQRLQAVDPNEPVIGLPPGDWLVGDGDLYLPFRGAPATTAEARIVRTPDGWTLDGDPIRADSLGQTLMYGWNQPSLPVALTPDLTVQDLVRICASARHHTPCETTSNW